MGYGTVLFLALTGSLITGAPQQKSPANSNPAVKPAVEKDVQVEKIARLKTVLDEAKDELAKLQSQLDGDRSEYDKALREFQELDAKLQKKKKHLEKLDKAKDKKAYENNMRELGALLKNWKQSKDSVALALQEHKTLQQKAKVLREKIEQDQQILDQLTGKEPAPGSKSQQAETAKPPETPPAATQTGKTPSVSPQAATPILPPAPTTPATSVLPQGGKPQNSQPPKEDSEELKKAKEVAKLKEAEAKMAGEKVKSLAARIETLKKNIRLDQQLLATARKKQDLILKTLRSLDTVQQQLLKKGASPKELWPGWQKTNEENRRLEKTRQEVRTITNNLTRLHEELNGLQQEQLAALKEASRKKEAAASAKQIVEDLQNPFAPKNVLQWSLSRGPQVLGILACMILFHFLVRVLSKRIVRVVGKTGKRKPGREHEQRAETLVGVFRNFSAIAIWGGGTLMLLETIDIPIVPLMGGAAVLGLAIAFGAQNLIRDYFTGFMILIEDQYAVRDYIRVGDIEGSVERITMRMTVLRGRDGSSHFVPHGTISSVTNYSHTWSRAFFDLGVAYKEDVDRVMAVVGDLGKELRSHREFGPMILDDLEMMGVDEFADSAVKIKFYLKTKPLKQWIVKREMLRRIKKRFDEIGIEIPFPHRTIYHRTDQEPQCDNLEEEKRRGSRVA